MARKSRFTTDIFAEWARRYEGGESTRQIGRAFGVNGGTVYACLQQMGAAFRRPSVSKRRYSHREDAFDRIGDEPTAYWLGFLFADGNLSSDRARRSVRLSLAERDEAHVEQFRRFLDCSSP